MPGKCERSSEEVCPSDQFGPMNIKQSDPRYSALSKKDSTMTLFTNKRNKSIEEREKLPVHTILLFQFPHHYQATQIPRICLHVMNSKF